MLEKYRKIILSQICALCAVGALILAYVRASEVGTWGDQTAISFIIFAVVLFALEIKLVFDWLKARSAAKN